MRQPSLLTDLGSQEVVVAVGDTAGNVTTITNSFRMSVVTNAAFEYSDAGCLSKITYTGADYGKTVDLQWNERYQLTSVSNDGSLAESYSYDALGRRVSVSDGSTTTYFVHDGIHVVAEVCSTGSLQRSYTWGPGVDNLLAMTDHTGTNPVTYYFLTDHLGTIHAAVDENKEIVELYRYDAWGRILGVYDSELEPIDESAIGNHFLFQGRWYSWETGLYYFRARWYDPVTGRWLSKDPIGIAGGLNQYVFCANNPVNHVDPLGLCKETSPWEGAWMRGEHIPWMRAYPNGEDVQNSYVGRMSDAYTMAQAAMAETVTHDPNTRWTYLHVLMSARIQRKHGSLIAWSAGWAKEFGDAIKGIWSTPNLRSAFQEQDIRLNRIGRNVPGNVTPERWAEIHQEPEGEPGPIVSFLRLFPLR